MMTNTMQSDKIWENFATLAKNLKPTYDYIMRDCSVHGKILNLLTLVFLYAIWNQIVIDVNVQILHK